MKFKGVLALFVLLALQGAEAKEKASVSLERNLQSTRNYYSQLVAGPAPKLAELTMFANMMPKGGDLHHHYSGSIYVETFLDWVGEQNYCIGRVTDGALKLEIYRMEARPQDLSDDARKACLSADAVRQDDMFYRELLKRWSDKDYDNHFHEQLAPDQQFFKTFEYFDAISSADYRKGLQSLKARAKEENLEYLETMLKGGPSPDKPELDALLGSLNAASTDQQIEEAFTRAFDLLANDAGTNAKIDAYVKFLVDSAEGIDDDTFKVRFQSYVPRNMSPTKTFARLYTSFAATTRSKLVVGVNFVGPENRPVAMRDYSLHMKMFRFLKQRFPGTKLSLHAGELVLGMVPPEGLRSHIREAVLVAGASRIGHAVDIAHETDAPALMAAMKKGGVAVEVNLTSNDFILGVRNEAHPLLLYARYGVPFVISTDDAGVSRNNISGEYMIYMSVYKPSYDDVKKIVYNSILYSFLPEDEKRAELAKLDKRFAEFEARVASLPRQGK